MSIDHNHFKQIAVVRGSLLNSVVTALRTQLTGMAEEADKDEYVVEALVEEAGFSVTSRPKVQPESDDVVIPFKCYITLTSTSMRKLETETESPETVKDPLPRDKCLHALALLRRSRWFSAMATSLPSCVECIRIVRDMCRRDNAWMALSDWSVELLVERALYSAWVPLNPAASLMRVMEVRLIGSFSPYANTSVIFC